MKPLATIGFPVIDDALAHFPEALTAIAPFERRLGYKAWKVPRRGQTTNWLQWNDGSTRLRITFPNSEGKVRTWKLFARFGSEPRWSGLWDKPEEYERKKAQWMPAGPDVWGCSYEALRERLGRLQELEELLKADLELSYRYSVHRYGKK